MSETIIILSIVGLVVVAGAIWIIRAGRQQVAADLRWFFTADNMEIPRHVALVVGMVLLLLAAKAYAVSVAEDKAGDWLTSYNGVATTKVVGPIKADQAQPITATPSPSPAATENPAQSSWTDQSQPTPSPLITVGSAPGSGPGTATPPGGSVSPTPTPTPPPTPAEQKRLDAQLRTIRDRIKHHGDVMAFFYVNYFVAIVMVMLAGLIVAVTLFFIAQGGWNSTSNYIETVFIVAAMWAAFYGLFPPVFQQQKNITDNKALFLEYKKLESELESFPITYLTLKDGAKTPREFISYVDSEMARLGNIALGFDVEKVGYQDAFSFNKSTPPQPNPSPTSTKSPSPPGGK